jgi:hypothetical protein
LQGTKGLTLDFHGKKFTVPRHSIFNLFEDQRDLFDATGYEVQSSMPLAIFEISLKGLETDVNVPVAKETACAIPILAKEKVLCVSLGETAVISG